MCTVLAPFFTVTIIFEGRGRGWKGFLLVNSHAELLLIGCTAWGLIDISTRGSAKVMALQTKKTKKRIGGAKI